ncbi:ankyrin repeat protein [Colletotrichum musicola]|uniref:Ankyrin repeat protein n=1 Tax=Colletotrichum musicola TaxID=2175873 RepID=A0A8H6N0Y8_9PEZI|nr:ankyrin repeat protein [Colletotrichum musicola]
MSKRALFLRSCSLFALLIILRGRAMASLLEDGEDFSNNLASDIAPLLALFGEKLTTQFMSQSTGWADCILLAVAPIGVITIIVSAIRVGGYDWLKAIVGRARENIIAAELEVMSSTSKEACELWNGQNVVRCAGAADICEFICIYPTATNREDITSARIMDIELATLEGKSQATVKKGIQENLQAILGIASQRPVLRIRSKKREQSVSQQQGGSATRRGSSLKRNTNQEDSKSSPGGTPANSASRPKEIVIVRNRTHPAPNISLNCQSDGRRWLLWLCAAIDVILQTGVLIYFGFVAEYHTLKFDKDGQPVEDYAMPLSVAGTLLLVFSMLVCGFVVNKGSKERTWEVADGNQLAISMVWLQKKKQVSNQHFESTAIYPVKKRNQVVTSERAIGVDRDRAKQSRRTSTRDLQRESQPAEIDLDRKKEHVLVRKLQIISLAGVCISLLGTVGQFTGLRGMHWTASIAQLGAAVIATILRAMIRRALAHGIGYRKLVFGHELDWFAISLSDIQTAVWLPKVRDNRGICQRLRSKVEGTFGRFRSKSGPTDGNSDLTSSCLWTIETGLPRATEATEDPQSPQGKGQHYQVDGLGTAQSILDLRRYLGELGNWKSPVFAEAVIRSKAIETTLDHFEGYLKQAEEKSPKLNQGGPKEPHGTFPGKINEHDSKTPNAKHFTWTLQVKVGHHNNVEPGPVRFHVERTANGWEARLDELDAALSLWLYSVYSLIGHREKDIPAPFPSSNDNWIRGKQIQGRCLQIIGAPSFRLVQDLEWWVPSGLEGIMTSSRENRDGQDERKLSPHDIRVERIGRAGQSSPEFRNDASAKRSSDTIERDTAEAITRWNLRPTELWDTNEGNTKEFPGDEHLIVKFQDSLPMLYAKDMFASFVWALVDQLEPLSVNQEVKAAVEPGDTTGREAWKKFMLKSPWLSRLVQTVVEIGTWTEQEVYLSLVPPLSASNNLPGIDALVDRALEIAASHEKEQRYDAALSAHLWLYNTAATFSPASHIYWKSVAALMRFNARLSGFRVTFLPSGFEDSHWRSPYMRSLRDLTRGNLDKIKFPMVQHKLQEALDGPKAQNTGTFSIAQDFTTRHEAKSTGNQDPSSPVLQKTVMLVSDICNPSVKDTEQVNGLSWQLSGSRWNPIEWQDEFTTALVDPQAWLLRLELRNHAADPNALDLDHWTPLHHACYTALHRHGVDDEPVEDFLSKYYQSRAMWLAKTFLGSKANVNARGLDGMTPLHCAALRGNSELLRFLIENGAEVTARDARGLGPLHFAAMSHDTKSIVELCKYRAPIDARDFTPLTPLAMVVISEDPGNESKEKASLELVRQGANADFELWWNGRNLLHYAVMDGQTELAEALIEKSNSPGKMLRQDDADGNTPRDLVESEADEMARLLDEALEKFGEHIEVGESSEGQEAATQSSSVNLEPVEEVSSEDELL